ncbi:helix-turn-helix domain-containing protein [Rhodococcus sp. H29-C3]|uniref:PucR family transcriptional regulator n=1 Tax=Rhodococcus sp. H29-C3 TaxID=3046307 RepID=UPI0024BA1445|nr:helix-turn-helix domain-containing protein [Rhodococcus sp. H29-C3]MDJ0359443.1 helix-turn-helix domain-containing protein [Rhodococcus sp. H29-C3]
MATSPPTTVLASTDLAAPLLDATEVLAETLVHRILDAEHGYLEASLLTEDELRSACRENLRAMIGCLAGHGAPDLSSAHATGRLKAEQGVPLAALLHAFRLGGRLIWEELMNRSDGEPSRALLEMAAQVWALVDVCSDAAAEAYRSTVDTLSEQDAESRRRLVRALFGDHVSNPAAVADAVRTFRIPDRGSFVVVSADSRDVELSTRGIGAVWDSEVDGTLGLLFATSDALLEEVLGSIDNGVSDAGSAAIGVSVGFSSPAGMPLAVEQARLARTCARVDGSVLTRFDAVPLPLLLARHPDSARAATRQIFGRLLELPDEERESLLTTLDAWFGSKGSTSEAASRLHYHRNTVLYRLRRIGELTGRDFLDPIQCSELYVGLRAYQLSAANLSGVP